MTRELLERAAKAASIDGKWCNFAGMNIRVGYQGGLFCDDPSIGYWNPLEDDGDALRLSASLCIDVLHRFVGGQRVEALAPGGPVITEYCDHETRGAAARTAIVRAAAQLTPNA